MTPNGFDAVHEMMLAAAVQGVFPGAVLLVARENNILFHHAYGFADLFSQRAATVDTVFDLASLTKPLATTLAVMLLVAEGRLNLEDRCGVVLPDLFPSGKTTITVEHLLNHSSGLPAWQPYFQYLRRIDKKNRQIELRRMIAREPLLNPVGHDSVYSDIGFMMLQWLVESVSGRALDDFVCRSIYQPLENRNVFFAHTGFRKRLGSVAATELCPWRNRLLIGEVHDDNAAIIGGVAGHAGLFGTALGVFDLLRGLLTADQGGAHRLFDTQLLHRFFTPVRGRTWALGFDTPSDQGSSAGERFPKNSVGHLGFTGTSFWMDRSNAVIVVLLTNRVHPTRHNTRIRVFRPALHDRIVSVLNNRGP